jgi:hypothetical protein
MIPLQIASARVILLRAVLPQLLQESSCCHSISNPKVRDHGADEKQQTTTALSQISLQMDSCKL